MKPRQPSFVDTQGRLGNQMFQYAFACRVAVESASRVFYDVSELGRFFRLDEGLVSRDRLHIVRFLAHWMEHVQEQDPQLDSLAATLRGRRYVGYFQGPHWFSGVEEYVQRAFAFRAEIERDVDRGKREVVPRGDFACVALRLGDYRIVGNGEYLLPAAWYRQAISRYVPTGMPVVLVSDETEEAVDYLGLRDVLVSTGELPLDFALIRDAAVKILSASSFSWWAAWLGLSKSVVVPEHWLGWSAGLTSPEGVLPREWTRLTVM